MTASLPTFYVKLGQAVHTLQDGFTHVFRTPDGMQVTTVLNWVEFAEERLDEQRDGPAHMGELDACEDLDDMRTRRMALAQEASIALFRAVLDPAQTRDQKAATIDALLDRYLGFQDGCTFDNKWCNAPEPALAATGGCACQASDGQGRGGLAAAGALALLVWLGLRRRRARRALGACLLLAALAGRSHADEPNGWAPVAPAAPATPAAPAVPNADADADADDRPPTPLEIAELHDAKDPGPRLGFAASLGLSIDRTALAASLGARFRLSPRWLVGADVEWNPWLVLHPLGTRPGVFNAYATAIRRYPMRLERVNLRTTVHLGMSMLLFDLYGARQGSIGPYLGISPLGIDVALGRGWKLIFDPLDLEIPAPHVTGVPLYYEQYRLVVGLQYGA